ncbi:MAG: MFS transporter [Bacteroidota bacterium]|nr:MFS transporter [Bacteroidota bacterium]
MKKKPRLSFWQIWNMSFGFLGIQFGFALQNANVSRIFETLGANIDNIPLLWIAAPVTGLIVQPIIGHMSDNTWNRLGRRRPYFLIGAILASIALLIMPNSPFLWVAAGMLWIMDASINVSMEPFRAFVGDMLPSRQRTIGFAMQSFFIGIGAVIASALPYILTNWLGFENTAAEGEIPSYVKTSFYIGAVVFIGAILWTVLGTKEYSPEELAEFDRATSEGENPPGYKADAQSEPSTEEGSRKCNKVGGYSFGIGILTIIMLYFIDVEKEVYILSAALIVFGIVQFIAGAMQRSGHNKNGLVAVMNDFNSMPLTMKQLAFVQFFSWFALFAMWIYTTTGITSEKYDMKLDHSIVSSLQISIDQIDPAIGEQKLRNLPEIREDLRNYRLELDEGANKVVASMKLVKFFLNTENGESMQLDEAAHKELIRVEQEYNKGADWVGVCFAVYNGLAAVFAFLLMGLARWTNRKITHMISLVVGGISFISIFFIKDPQMLLISFVGIGLVWASILAMPYAILTGSLPSNKMGVYMGIFNFFIVIPQIVAASILGFFVKDLFGGQAIYALILGGVSLFLAAVLVLFVDDVDYVKIKKS